MNWYGSITPIRKICKDGRRRGEVRGGQQVDNRSVLEKMHYRGQMEHYHGQMEHFHGHARHTIANGE